MPLRLVDRDEERYQSSPLHTHVGEGRLPFILKRVPSDGERAQFREQKRRL